MLGEDVRASVGIVLNRRKQSTLGCSLICGGGCLLNINQRLSQALGTARNKAKSQEKVMKKEEAT